jgi:hypothetical protein
MIDENVSDKNWSVHGAHIFESPVTKDVVNSLTKIGQRHCVQLQNHMQLKNDASSLTKIWSEHYAQTFEN